MVLFLFENIKHLIHFHFLSPISRSLSFGKQRFTVLETKTEPLFPSQLLLLPLGFEPYFFITFLGWTEMKEMRSASTL